DEDGDTGDTDGAVVVVEVVRRVRDAQVARGEILDQERPASFADLARRGAECPLEHFAIRTFALHWGRVWIADPAIADGPDLVAEAVAKQAIVNESAALAQSWEPAMVILNRGAACGSNEL